MIIVVSNHLFATTHVTFPEDIVVRLNLAWMKDKETAIETLKGITHDVYLDYPQGRTKPPKPVITMEEALEMAGTFSQVKYFAVSNVEEEAAIAEIRSKLPAHIELVPKIESERGVNNLPAIIRGAQTKFAMLDKEDLYLDVKRDMDLFNSLNNSARAQAKEVGITLLELQGVVFA